MTQVHDDGGLLDAGSTGAPPAPTRTSTAFGALEVGPPVSRLDAAPAPEVVAGPGRCPACGSRVRADQPWCLLCHTDLHAPTDLHAVSAPPVPAAQVAPAAPVTAPTPSAVTDRDEQLVLELDDPATAPVGTAPVEPVTVEPALDEEEVERMLRHLASAGSPRLPALGTRQARIAVAVGGSVGLAALLLGGTAVFGALTG